MRSRRCSKAASIAEIAASAFYFYHSLLNLHSMSSRLSFTFGANGVEPMVSSLLFWYHSFPLIRLLIVE